MDIHEPKPRHGLREFLREIGIVVIGVLIALGAQQSVDWLNLQAELRENRDALRSEISDNLRAVNYAAQEDRCYLKVLDLVEAWAKGGARPEVPGLGLLSPVSVVWETAKTGAVAQMPLAERLKYAELYEAVSTLQQLNLQQRAQGSVARGYMALDTLTPDEARGLRRELGGYRQLLRAKISNDQAFIGAAQRLGVKAPPLQEIRRARLKELCGLAGLEPEGP